MNRARGWGREHRGTQQKGRPEEAARELSGDPFSSQKQGRPGEGARELHPRPRPRGGRPGSSLGPFFSSPKPSRQGQEGSSVGTRLAPQNRVLAPKPCLAPKNRVPAPRTELSGNPLSSQKQGPSSQAMFSSQKQGSSSQNRALWEPV